VAKNFSIDGYGFSVGIIRFFWVSCEEGFTTEAQSSQSSENFLIKNSLLRALRASAVQSPDPLFTGKPEDPTKKGNRCGCPFSSSFA
jgi:hypothetical protein